LSTAVLPEIALYAADPYAPRLPLADALRFEAARYRRLDTPLSAWLARLIDDQAEMVRYTHAETIEDHLDRLDQLERWRDRRLREEGSR
jgi:hypothetical protein